MSTNQVINAALSSGLASESFAARYNYVEVKNTSATAADVLYVRTDGTAATVGGAGDNYLVAAGERALIPNDQAMWWQGYGGPGGTSNPGTVIKLAGATSGDTTVFEIVGCG